jgi:hypothetical protein
MLTRRGRCGEFANAFCLILRSLRLDARYVLDFTDHVWCEVWLPSLQRYVHCDPCERALDTPLMYESGWNKKLTHLLSFSRHGVCDAMPRYSRKQGTVLLRRSAEVVNEGVVASMIAAKDRELSGAYAMRRATTAAGDASLPWDAVEGAVPYTTTPMRVLSGGATAVQALVATDLSWPALQQRRRLHERELHALRLSTDLSSTAHCTQGRISGDLEWRLARGETEAALAAEGDAGAKKVAATAPNAVPPPPARIVPPAWLQGLPPGYRLYLPTSAWLQAVDASSPCHGFSNACLPSPTRDAGTLLRLGESGKTLALGNDAGFLKAMGAASTSDLTLAVSQNAVRRTRNGATEESALPEYVLIAAGEHLSQALTTTNHSYYIVGGHCCAVAQHVLYPDGTDKSVEYMVGVATARCNEDSALVGFSVILSAAAGEVACVMLFGDSGYPLIPCSTVRTHLRLVECAPAVDHATVPPAEISAAAESVQCVASGCMSEALQPLQQAPSAPECSDTEATPNIVPQLAYYFMGGASHGDTVAFDTATFLCGLSQRGLVGPRLSKITLWAGRQPIVCQQICFLSYMMFFMTGDNLVNGVQCHFEAQSSAAQDPHPFSTPACNSDQDSPVPKELALPAGERVVSVRCRSGALVDSVELVTASGQVLRAGGSGGGDSCQVMTTCNPVVLRRIWTNSFVCALQVDVPEGMELAGFFGGTLPCRNALVGYRLLDMLCYTQAPVVTCTTWASY